MLTAREIIDSYISFFEKRGHKQIANSSIVPIDDPTTLFTSSGMQPLISYLLGEPHPAGNRLVNVQNSFRAVDIDEVGDNRHTTFFRMLGNWSLGDPASPGEDASQGGYFKKEEIPWLWEFLTVGLGLPSEKLFITVFSGDENVEKDNESFEIWKTLVPESKIFFAGVDKNWWSRSGVPKNMPIGEPGGPDTEVYFKFDDIEHGNKCEGDNPAKCECGKFLEIANSVFMQYKKTTDGFKPLPKQNVDFGGGVERLLAAIENKSDMFKTSLFAPIIVEIERVTEKKYKGNEKHMRIIADHFIASVFLTANNLKPSNKERGYILRRLIRRGYDHFYALNPKYENDFTHIREQIIDAYKDTDPYLVEKHGLIEHTIQEEGYRYEIVKKEAENFIFKKYRKRADDDSLVKEIDADDAFKMYATHGLSPTQIKSLGYTFNEQKFADLMKKHKDLSKTASAGMFKGGLADTSELTIMGHTATHLLHQALRDVFGESLHQTGSNITSERVRFDFNFDRNLTNEEIKQVEEIVNEKIKDNLPVHFEMLPLEKAKELSAIGLFDEKYAKDVKVYFIGDYSKEFCGGPHVDFTGKINRFKIIKQENLGKGQKRIYATIG